MDTMLNLILTKTNSSIPEALRPDLFSGDAWTNMWPATMHAECLDGLAFQDLSSGTPVDVKLSVDELQRSFRHIELPCLMLMANAAEHLPEVGTYFSGKPLTIGGSDHWQPVAEKLVGWEGKKVKSTTCFGAEGQSWEQTYIINDFFTDKDFISAEMYLSPLDDLKLSPEEAPLQDRGAPRDYFVVDYRRDTEEWCPNASDDLSDLNIAKVPPFSTVVDAIRPLYRSNEGTVYLGRTLAKDQLSDAFFTIAWFTVKTDESGPLLLPDNAIEGAFQYTILGFLDSLRALTGEKNLINIFVSSPLKFLGGDKDEASPVQGYTRALIMDAIQGMLRPRWAPQWAMQLPSFTARWAEKLYQTFHDISEDLIGLKADGNDN